MSSFMDISSIGLSMQITRKNNKKSFIKNSQMNLQTLLKSLKKLPKNPINKKSLNGPIKLCFGTICKNSLNALYLTIFAW
jgi:hypothetical protein